MDSELRWDDKKEKVFYKNRRYACHSSERWNPAVTKNKKRYKYRQDWIPGQARDDNKKPKMTQAQPESAKKN